jgi:hypothetical protein
MFSYSNTIDLPTLYHINVQIANSKVCFKYCVQVLVIRLLIFGSHINLIVDKYIYPDSGTNSTMP